jgi:hypothetical protein
VARIEPGGQPPDRPDRAGRVPALEQDGQGRPEAAGADLAAGLQSPRGQPALGMGQAIARLRARQRLVQVALIESSHVRIVARSTARFASPVWVAIVKNGSG